MCCRGSVCRVVVTKDEQQLFPTAQFADRVAPDGRRFFEHACPHIAADGCQIYATRPKDCAAFNCKTLTKLRLGRISETAARQTIDTIKADIAEFVATLDEEAVRHRSFQELARDWVSEGRPQTHPNETRRLLSILKRLDQDLWGQSDKIADLQTRLLSSTPDLQTPAYVVDDLSLDRIVSGARDVIGDSGAKLLYSVKANAVAAVLERLGPLVDGFSCSSLPEVEIVRRVMGPKADIHFVGPGISPDDAETLLRECKHISFNSLSLFQRYGRSEAQTYGLRVNPHLSLNSNPRYDPCRPHSKLGISIYDLQKAFRDDPEAFRQVDGLHVHNATGIDDFKKLAATVNIITEALPDLMARISWINLGGGYRIHTCKNPHDLWDTVKKLQKSYDLTVYLEPGTALVRNGCWLVSTVIDVFRTEGRDIAILDTSINHQLEGYIYNFPPNVASASKNGSHAYQLAGASCLAGDLFGEHRFDEPLKIGSRVIFSGIGAYTHAFTTRYNGLNPPGIYQLQTDQSLRLRRHFGIEDFAGVCGV